MLVFIFRDFTEGCVCCLQTFLKVGAVTIRLSMISGITVGNHRLIVFCFLLFFFYMFFLQSFCFSLFYPAIYLIFFMPSPTIRTIFKILYQSKQLYFYRTPIFLIEYGIKKKTHWPQNELSNILLKSKPLLLVY